MEFQLTSCVRGYHVYKAVWSPSVGEEFQCEREEGNSEDPYAVAIKHSGEVVGHVPRLMSAACSLFLRRLGTITCRIIGSRRYSADLPQGGLELPCCYIFRANATLVEKLKKLLSARVLSARSDSCTETDDTVVIEDGSTNDRESNESSAWLSYSGIQLFESDRLILQSRQLSAHHIDFAQEVLKRQCPLICGLQSTLLISESRCSRVCLPKNSLFIQIVFSKSRKHWITVSASGSQSSIKIYDSVFTTVEDDTKKLCEKWFGPERKVEIVTCAQQEGGTDCGVYAIGYCVALAYNKKPFFSRAGIRLHLIQCFEQLSLTPFPQ